MGTWRNKRKDDWRRWLWNRFADCIPMHKRSSAVGLYLPGADDAEMPVATSKGFNARNLIGIESDNEITRKLRKNGRLVVNDDLINTIWSWPNDWPIKFMSLDLCCGVDVEANNIATAILCKKSLRKCVIGLNFLRGRDLMGQYYGAVPGDHRGRGFIEVVLAAAASVYISPEMCRIGETTRRKGYGETRLHGLNSIPRSVWAPYALKTFKPQYFSYKSDRGNQYFDSVVFCWDADKYFSDIWNSVDLKYEPSYLDPEYYVATIRQIRAIRAHHTMKCNKAA